MTLQVDRAPPSTEKIDFLSFLVESYLFIVISTSQKFGHTFLFNVFFFICIALVAMLALNPQRLEPKIITYDSGFVLCIKNESHIIMKRVSA